MNKGDGTFATRVDYPVGTPVQTLEPIVAVDLNEDGRPDLAVMKLGADVVSVLFNNGNGSFAAPVDYPIGPSTASLTAADLNGDGRPDLSVTRSSGTVGVLLETCMP